MKILRKLTVLWTVLALLVALIITPNVSHAADMNVNMPNSDRMRNNDMNQTDQGMRPDMSTNGGRRNGRGRM